MLKVGIVGVGGYGSEHLKGLLPLENEGRIKVTAMSDLSAGALERALRFFPDAEQYSEYQAFLDEADVEAVILAIPIPLHEKMTLEAIRRGLFVLLEKPAVPLLSQWHRLTKADVGRKVAIGFQQISSPALQIVRRLIENGALGSLQSLSVSAVWPRTDWYYNRNSWAGKLFWNSLPVLDGPASNAMAHYINDMMYLAGNATERFAVPYAVCAEVYRARRIPAYDTACVQGSFLDGPRFLAAFSHASTQDLESRFRVEGSEGTVWIQQDGTIRSKGVKIPAFEPTGGRMEMWKGFVDFASGRRSHPDVSLHDVKGYTLATNLMFYSAGSIRTISAEHAGVATYRGEPVIEIAEIGSYLRKASDSLCALSEIGVPWAMGGEAPVSASDFSEVQMLAGLRLGATEPSMRDLVPVEETTD